MQTKESKRLESIKIIMILINLVAVLFVTVFIYSTTKKICDHFIARDFISEVKAIPFHPFYLMVVTGGLFLLLIVSFLLREVYYASNIKVIFLTLVADFVVSIAIILLLNFNYNGILFYVFANVVAYAKGNKGKYLLMFLAIVSYLVADYELIGINYNLFSIQDYIRYYDAQTQQYVISFYNILMSLNIINFIIYCVYVIQEQRGTINEVNMLYSKLSQANEDLQKANEQLKEYAVITEKIGETRERNRLAREIHDTLGHTLTGISAGVDACIAMVEKTPGKTKEQLEVIAKVTRQGILDIRRSVTELRPDALERLSLEYAITKLITDMNEVSNTKVIFENKVTHLKFDEDEENAIYRVIQESITNAIRHGKASEVMVTIDREEAKILLTIKDNGVGCKEMKKGFGTRHITERIEMLNGTVTFDGSNGFTVFAQIPIRWGEEYD